MVAEKLQEGSAALLELAKKVNATSPVEAQPQQPQKSVYLVRRHGTLFNYLAVLGVPMLNTGVCTLQQ